MTEIFLLDMVAYFALILLTGIFVIISADSFYFKWNNELKKTKLKTLANLLWIVAISNLHVIAWSNFFGNLIGVFWS